MEKLKKIRNYLGQLQRAHLFYKVANEKQKTLIVKRCEFIIVGLEELGVRREFTTLLLLEGKKFLDSEYPELKKKIDELGYSDEEIEEALGQKMVKMSKEEVKHYRVAKKKRAIVYRVDSKDGKIEVLLSRKNILHGTLHESESLRQDVRQVKLNV